MRFSSCLSHEAASPSACNCLPHSCSLFSLLPSQRAATLWGTHLWPRAGREGRWHILSPPTPSSGTGPRQTDEPGILSTWLSKLTEGQGRAQGRGGKCIEYIEISDIHWVAGMFHGIQSQCVYRDTQNESSQMLGLFPVSEAVIERTRKKKKLNPTERNWPILPWF